MNSACRCLTTCLLTLVAACPIQPVLAATAINDQNMADDSRGENWLAYGRTYSEQRYSPLTHIDRSNVGSL